MDTEWNGRTGRWAAVTAVAVSIAITVFAPLSGGPPSTPADSEATTVVVDVEPAGPLGQGLMSQLRPAPNADSDAGTRAASPESVSAESIAAVVSEFARHYLRFDYRATPSERLEALAPLTTGELLDQLSTPLPPLLVDQLAATQQIATVEVLSVLTVHDNPTAFHVVVAVTTTDAGGVSTEIRGLDLTVARRDGAWLIGDVR